MKRIRGKNNKFELENNMIKVIFNSNTGCIESVINKRVKKDMLSYKKNSQLFRIVYAIENYRGHHFDSKDQKVDDFSILKNGNKQTIFILYKSLSSGEGIFKLNLTIEVSLEDNSDELIMSIKIVNNDKGEVSQVWFPWIRGFKTIGDNPEKDILVYPGMGGALITNPMSYFSGKGEATGFHEWTRELATTILAKPYPGKSSMQWMNLGCKSHGLYLACLNKEGNFLVPRVQKHLWCEEEHLSLSMVKYPYIKYGGSWESPTYILSPHLGDWHVGADKYRNWLNGWLIKREKSAWAKETNGFYHFILRHQDGTTINNIEDIPNIIFTEAKQHGINLLFVCGWYKSGHDGGYPNYEPNQPEKLKRIFKRIKESEGHILLYFNMRSYNMSNPDYNKEGYRWTVKTHDGLPAMESWGWAIPHYPSYELSCFASMCPGAKGWQKKFLEEMMKTLELGAECALFDQLLVVDLCHDSNHGHKFPESSYGPGSIEMLEKALERGKKINPEFELSMEGLVDIYTPYIAIFHSRVDLTDYSNPEVFRYTLPWVTGITGGFIDMGLKDKLYQSFLLGLPLDIEIHTHNYGRLSFDPELAREIKRVNMLRDKYKDIFTNGEFRDDVGLEVKNEYLLAKLIKSETSAVLTLWNRNKCSCATRLIIDPCKSGFRLVSPKAYFDEDGNTGSDQTLKVRIGEKEISIDVPEIKADEIALIKLEGIKSS